MICTLDWNCIIDLEENRLNAPHIWTLVNLHREKVITLYIHMMGRFENPKQGILSTYPEFEQRLVKLGLNDLEIGQAQTGGYCDTQGNLTYDAALERAHHQKIHQLLFPAVAFTYHEYCSEKKSKPVRLLAELNITKALEKASEERRKIWHIWKNAKCDAYGLFAHVTYHGQVYVTRDENTLNKKGQLQHLVPGEILTPRDAVEYVHTYVENETYHISAK